MNRQLIFFILFLLILLGTGYIWIQYAKEGRAPVEEEKIDFEGRLSQLRKLKNLKLDTSILEDSFFQSLELPGESAVPATEPAGTKGRINPYLAP